MSKVLASIKEIFISQDLNGAIYSHSYDGDGSLNNTRFDNWTRGLGIRLPATFTINHSQNITDYKGREYPVITSFKLEATTLQMLDPWLLKTLLVDLAKSDGVGVALAGGTLTKVNAPYYNLFAEHVSPTPADITTVNQVCFSSANGGVFNFENRSGLFAGTIQSVVPIGVAGTKAVFITSIPAFYPDHAAPSVAYNNYLITPKVGDSIVITDPSGVYSGTFSIAENLSPWGYGTDGSGHIQYYHTFTVKRKNSFVMHSTAVGAGATFKSLDRRMGYDIELTYGIKDRALKISLERGFRYNDAIEIINASAISNIPYVNGKIPELREQYISKGYDNTNKILIGQNKDALVRSFDEVNITDFVVTIKSKSVKNAWGISNIVGYDVEIKLVAMSTSIVDVATIMEQYITANDINLYLDYPTTKKCITFKAGGLSMMGSFSLSDDKREMSAVYKGHYDIDYVAMTINNTDNDSFSLVFNNNF